MPAPVWLWIIALSGLSPAGEALAGATAPQSRGGQEAVTTERSEMRKVTFRVGGLMKTKSGAT